MISTTTRLRQGLRLELDDAVVCTPSLGVRHRGAWARADGALELAIAGGKLRARALDFDGEGMWTDYQVEVLEELSLRSLACVWVLDGGLSERARAAQVEIARTSPVTHASDAEDVELVGAFRARRACAGAPDGWAGCFEIASTRAGHWELRSVVAPSLEDAAGAAARFEHRARARVAPGLPADPSGLRALPAGTTLRVGLASS